MNHFYHGLFGSPSNWSSVITKNSNNLFHNLYHKSKEDLLNLKTNSRDNLIGYSMGGRIVLEIARRNDFNLNQLILLSAHPGLLPFEKEPREIWEDEVLTKMKTLSVEEFAIYWNSLSIFNSSVMNRNITNEKLRQSAYLFEEFRLSKMPSYFDYFKKNKNKITWIIGESDSKYIDLINERVVPLGIKTILVKSDHRVLEAPQKIIELLKTKGIV